MPLTQDMQGERRQRKWLRAHCAAGRDHSNEVRGRGDKGRGGAGKGRGGAGKGRGGAGTHHWLPKSISAELSLERKKVRWFGYRNSWKISMWGMMHWSGLTNVELDVRLICRHPVLDVA